jgi:hypothetical protein
LPQKGNIKRISCPNSELYFELRHIRVITDIGTGSPNQTHDQGVKMYWAKLKGFHVVISVLRCRERYCFLSYYAFL